MSDILLFVYKALCTPWKRRYTNVIMYVCMYVLIFQIFGRFELAF